MFRSVKCMTHFSSCNFSAQQNSHGFLAVWVARVWIRMKVYYTCSTFCQSTSFCLCWDMGNFCKWCKFRMLAPYSKIETAKIWTARAAAVWGTNNRCLCRRGNFSPSLCCGVFYTVGGIRTRVPLPSDKYESFWESSSKHIKTPVV